MVTGSRNSPPATEIKRLLGSFPDSKLDPNVYPNPKLLRSGYSGATVLLARYLPKWQGANALLSATALKGWYVVKIGNKRWARREEHSYKNVTSGGFERVAARYVSRTPDESGSNWVAIAYTLAFESLTSSVSLKDLLDDDDPSKEKECIRNIEQLVDHLVRWDSQFWQPGQMSFRPLDLIKSMFERERLQKVLLRIAINLPKWNMDTPEIYIQDVSSSTKLLPNPLAYLREVTWQNLNDPTGKALLPVSHPQGDTHGDLHAGNVICLPGSSDCPQVIDFSDYDANKCLFFDLAYLEFDLLRTCFSFSEKPGRIQWFDFLVRAKDKINLSDELSQTYPRAFNLISPIRSAVRERITDLGLRSDQEGYTIAWWAAVMAVGLNYASKKGIKTNDMKAALLYAAFGLDCLLSGVLHSGGGAQRKSYYRYTSTTLSPQPVFWTEDLETLSARNDEGLRAVRDFHHRISGAPLSVHLPKLERSQKRFDPTWQELRNELREQRFVCTSCAEVAQSQCCYCTDATKAHALLVIPDVGIKSLREFEARLKIQVMQMKIETSVPILSISPHSTQRHTKKVRAVLGDRCKLILFTHNELFEKVGEDNHFRASYVPPRQMSNNYVVAKAIQWALLMRQNHWRN